jgi:S-formylglutathione hydrolase FrmB
MLRARLMALLALAGVLIAGLGIAKPYIWPDKHGARTEHFTIKSRYAHRSLGVSVVIPSGAGESSALLIYLHGRNGDENSEMRNDAMFKELARLGRRAPIVAFPDGTSAGYWHDRRSGRFATYVTREVIPQVAKRYGTSTRHVAIGGTSMGGYGALEIAREHPGVFCAVGGHSPAIWRTGGETAPGAFDDAEDFARHDLVATARAKPGRFAGPRLWLDAGQSDPFQPGDKAFVAALRAAHLKVHAHLTWKGGHDHAYWQRHWPKYLDFYASALAHCG